MPIPFAQIDSEDSSLWNLQLHFWRNAVEHFEAMGKCIDEYEADEAAFGVDASMVIVLGGTSISQLLGQQWREGNIKIESDRDDRVPQMTTLLRRLIRNASRERLSGLPFVTQGLLQELEQFVTVYDGIRHFGEPKHEVVASLDRDSLCHYMTLLQRIWHAVAALRPNPSALGSDFSYNFEFRERCSGA